MSPATATSTTRLSPASSRAGCGAAGYGRRRAEQKLRERGLRGAVADAALDEAYGEQDEAELAREALGRRPVADDADRRRALAFLARRGFSAGAAWAAIRRAGDGGIDSGDARSRELRGRRRAPAPAAIPGTPEAVATLERDGVTLFVDLTHPSDPLPDYGQWLVDGCAGSRTRSPTWERRPRAT